MTRTSQALPLCASKIVERSGFDAAACVPCELFALIIRTATFRTSGATPNRSPSPPPSSGVVAIRTAR